MNSHHARVALRGEPVCDDSLRVKRQLNLIAAVPWSSLRKEGE
jgi:hypothetical protein